MLSSLEETVFAVSGLIDTVKAIRKEVESIRSPAKLEKYEDQIAASFSRVIAECYLTTFLPDCDETTDARFRDYLSAFFTVMERAGFDRNRIIYKIAACKVKLGLENNEKGHLLHLVVAHQDHYKSMFYLCDMILHADPTYPNVFDDRRIGPVLNCAVSRGSYRCLVVLLTAFDRPIRLAGELLVKQGVCWPKGEDARLYLAAIIDLTLREQLVQKRIWIHRQLMQNAKRHLKKDSRELEEIGEKRAKTLEEFKGFEPSNNKIHQCIRKLGAMRVKQRSFHRLINAQQLMIDERLEAIPKLEKQALGLQELRTEVIRLFVEELNLRI